MAGEDESDQLPESGPGGQSPDDASGSAGDSSRKEATENPGGSDEGDDDAGDATGNPANAG